MAVARPGTQGGGGVEIGLSRCACHTVRRCYEDRFVVVTKKTLFQHVFTSVTEGSGNFATPFLSAATD
eukprot:5081132-Prymnesium_polylepis.1